MHAFLSASHRHGSASRRLSMGSQYGLVVANGPASRSSPAKRITSPSPPHDASTLGNARRAVRSAAEGSTHDAYARSPLIRVAPETTHEGASSHAYAPFVATHAFLVNRPFGAHSNRAAWLSASLAAAGTPTK